MEWLTGLFDPTTISFILMIITPTIIIVAIFAYAAYKAHLKHIERIKKIKQGYFLIDDD